eukprot:9728771-Heterocapsa_arctica.AAC.1
MPTMCIRTARGRLETGHGAQTSSNRQSSAHSSAPCCGGRALRSTRDAVQSRVSCEPRATAGR